MSQSASITELEILSDGEHGTRSIDLMPKLFGQLVNAMQEAGADVLGDLFEGAITYGERGQFLTPESLTDLMARMVEGGDGESVCDPCCGSGRMLLSAARVNPRRIFVGQDIDHRCVQMTAINLALNGLKGYAVWGNSLASEIKRVYKIGFIAPGVIVRESPQRFAERFQVQKTVFENVGQIAQEQQRTVKQVVHESVRHHQGELFD